MISVSLETSARPASVAVRVGERRVERVLVEDRAHASDLLPALAMELSGLGAQPGDIDTVVVGTGPGSYTGLRVGIATALGLARGSGARLLGLGSLEALAWRSLALEEEAVVLLDARGQALYFAHLVRRTEDVELLCAPRLVRREELDELLPDDVRILGDATVAQAARLSTQQIERLDVEARPSAGALLELGERRLERHGAMEPGEIAPLYLRPFEARTRRR